MNLDELRNEIDRIDEQMVRLLNDRAGLAVEIGKIKRERNTAAHDPEREDAVLKHVGDVNRGPLSEESLRRVYGVIIGECLRLED
jgi:chorismate mutase-like protein